ncbi:hypothetical protein ACFWU5_10705 [Nocardia sp. NPDC058640]|uniref:hypothetical protein n=1 Tax=Nocardia sp. NPDC058640 TaxID=3346571 RepID=UPI00364B7576
MDTDVDRVLPHLFEVCVKGGRPSRILTDPKNYPGYLEALVDNENMVDFDSPDARALLDGWLRSSVVDMGTQINRSVEQMLAVAPITLAAYRSGVPFSRSRHRYIDEVTYRLLRAQVAQRVDNQGNADGELRRIIVETIGHGIRVGPAPKWEPELVDASDLDITALLEFRFLEGFEMGEVRSELKPAAKELNSPLPLVTDRIGKMLLDHLLVYATRLPTAALMSTFAGLLAVNIFALTLRLNAHGRTLLTGAGQPDNASAASLELYCDFTGGIDDESDKLSRLCVERDLNQLRLSFRDRMTFLIVDKATERMPGETERLATMTAEERLRRLAELRTNQRVELVAMSQFDEITATNKRDGDTITEDEADFLDRVQQSNQTELEKLLQVLDYVNQDKATSNTVGWFHSVGGLQKPYGILSGFNRSRQSWRYAPSDELLTTLLLTIFVRSSTEYRSTMPLRELLTELRERFGILIDEPPRFLDGAEARAAATNNLAAFKRRLQLLGCFDSLSDDFSEQIVRHPLGDRHA